MVTIQHRHYVTWAWEMIYYILQTTLHITSLTNNVTLAQSELTHWTGSCITAIRSNSYFHLLHTYRKQNALQNIIMTSQFEYRQFPQPSLHTCLPVHTARAVPAIIMAKPTPPHTNPQWKAGGIYSKRRKPWSTGLFKNKTVSGVSIFFQPYTTS